jgi:hypothetical protein
MVVPNPFKEHRASHYFSFLPHQLFKETKLSRLEHNSRPVASDLALQQIHVNSGSIKVSNFLV